MNGAGHSHTGNVVIVERPMMEKAFMDVSDMQKNDTSI